MTPVNTTIDPRARARRTALSILRFMVPAVLPALAMLPACAGEDAADSTGAKTNKPAISAELLAPPPAGRGVQYKMVTELGPGEESEHCMFVRSPPETTFVQRDEIRFTTGSHHVLLYETVYDDVPTRKDDGTEVDTSGVFDCSDGATNGWSVTKLIAGSQNGMSDSFLSFPPGIAMRVNPNALLMINAHYINTRTEIARPEIRINLNTIPENEVEQEGDLLFMYNYLIKVGAGAKGRARMRCPVHRDITIANVQSHMHRRGIGYAAMVEGQEPFYESDQWEGVPVKAFENGLQIKAGQRLDYYCDYESQDDHDIFQGPRSTDEMCMLIGSYYPADRATANCLQTDGEAGASEWVGNGKTNCAQTLACASAATGDDLKELTNCMDQADPAVAAVASNALRCTFNSMEPETDCAAEMAACRGR